MRLADCLQFGELVQGDPQVEVQKVVYDSRQAGPGTLFVAIPGFQTDGHTFIADAVNRGARAIVVEQPVDVPPEAAVLRVASTRRALSALASALYQWPSRRMRVLGVTGTNGKTTTTHLIRSILQRHGRKVGLIGTVHNFVGDEELPSRLTTPQAADVQELLHRMAQVGCEYAVMEVSSEGIAMNRVDHVEFDQGVFTNLTQDHLNYHKTFENYREAKMQLFRMLGEGGSKTPKRAIVNRDDPSAQHFCDVCQVPVYTYGLGPDAVVSAREIEISAAGSRFTLVTPQGEIALAIGLAGRFNVYNALAAAATCLAEGVDLATIKEALESTSGVAGRMEAVDAGQPFGVFVDYAHSPDGLENVLRTAQGFAKGRVFAVFGCGGDRDRSKRPLMGRIAAQLADYTIVTSDNPRSENPEQIVADIEAGIREVLPAQEHYEVIIDRASAIRRAIALASANDVIVIAGKGHETYQIFKDRTIAFDDRQVARAAIAAHEARKEGA
jgi:UDP-N-acetylmuramoyl-L-alanyl-D-glutamate--2,6-diaminopimelate ligase